jgi:hypothetical protein
MRPVPSSKRKFGRSSLAPDALSNLLDAWFYHACEFGEVEISGWQGYEGSNTFVEDIVSFDGFIQAYSEDPPRTFLSARTAGRAVEVSVDYWRGDGAHIFIRMPTAQMVDEVFEALEAGAQGNGANIEESLDQSHECQGSRGDPQVNNRPLYIDNAASLVQRKGNDVIVAKLRWNIIDDEEFERLLFNIVANADGYANPKWLMRTNAPDRSRDISVERLTNDTLSGMRMQRIIIQAKHWLTKSLRPDHISAAVTQMALWEPPLVSVLIMAASGRFTADAVTWVEKHNEAGKRPVVEMWPESHLELILANMPGLVDQFGLR